jgi:hypothetical protein
MYLVCTVLAAVPASGQAISGLDLFPSPRQNGMGGAGVALLDMAHGAKFNPALPGLSFRRRSATVMFAPAWSRLKDFHESRDWNAPYGLEKTPKAWAGYPSLYYPGVGFIGLHRQSFSTDWDPDYREFSYALSVATAPDFLEEESRHADRNTQWTTGMSLKYYESWLGVADMHAKGFALDWGLAWMFTRIPGVPGLESVLGLSVSNLGSPVQYGPGNQNGYWDPLPEQYRLGYSLKYLWGRPFRKLPGKLRPVKFTVTQEIHKHFHAYDGNGRAMPFFRSFFHDLRKSPLRYWRETETHMGMEITLLEIASLRLGRESLHGYEPDLPFYTRGFGLGTGTLVRPFFFQYDMSRYLVTRAIRDGLNRSWPTYGFRMGAWF